jgi:putative salt-induced outer membrane protein
MLKQMVLALVVFLCVASAKAQAPDVHTDQGATNESEASIVALSGNAESTTYSGKQATSYKLDLNKLAFAGRYQQVFATPPTLGARVSQETARNWLGSLRYERELSEKFSLFAQQSAESDVFAGLNQRYNTDLGAKYQIYKDDLTDWSSELGYRYSSEFRVGAAATNSNTDVRLHFARIYTKVTHKISDNVTAALWVEYLPNFTQTDDWQRNAEASITSQVSKIFSLKTAYLERYRNTLVGTARENSDRSFTTAIVAKY